MDILVGLEEDGPIPLVDRVDDGSLYRYEPLDGPDSLRVLVLEPGSLDEDISCSLRHVSLSACPAYEALSYVWGTNGSTHVVYHGKDIIHVTANLHAALKQLRHHDTPRVLWADAICINQKDIPERNQQVTIMGNIYRSAEGVIVWLGEEGDGDEIAIEIISTFDSDSGLDGFGEDLFDPNIVSNPDASPFELDSEDQWHALTTFFGRSWFRRVWVIQEVATASNVQVVCGTRICAWPALSRFALYLRDNALGIFIQIRQAINNLRVMTILRRMAQGFVSEFPLAQLLWLTRSFECTVEHDNVFALLGLVSPAGTVGVKVDYGRPCAAIFAELAVGSIPIDTFQVLSTAGYHEENTRKGLPSWVPDWSFEPETFPINPLKHFMNYEAAADSVTDASVSACHQILTVAGYIFDTIEQLASQSIIDVKPEHVPDIVETLRNQELQMRSRLKECHGIAKACEPYPTGEEWLNALSRTIVCDMLKSEDDCDEQPTDQIYVQGYLALVELLDLGYDQDESEIDKHAERREDLVEKTRQYEQSINMRIGGRRFCASRKRYMGWVPHSTTPTDIICIFKGAEVPYVLRPIEDDHYLLIGECYIHGIMYGEAMSQGLVEHKFKIR